MVTRLAHFFRNSTFSNTYRFALSDLTTTTNAGSTGIAFEIFGAANRRVFLRHVQISKPSVDISPFKINVYTVGSSTSASTGISYVSPVNIGNITGSTYPGQVRTYTSLVAQSTGTLLDQIQEIDLLTTDVMNEHYGDDQGKFVPALRGSTQSYGFYIATTGPVILNGYVEFSVEP